MVPGPLTTFLLQRQELVVSASPGTAAARELSDLTDAAVSALAAPALERMRTPAALFATGGWGARRLLPASDLDLLVVTSADQHALEPLVTALLYPLWDAGLAVGHQVRSPREHLAALGSELESLTGFLTARPIAGDRRLASRVSADAFRRIRRRGVAGDALSAIIARERPGSPYLLEPELKNGAGGQRDLDELTWTAALRSGAHALDPQPLVGLGLLSPAEYDALGRAADAITSARWRLHTHASRPTNTLTIESAHDASIDAENLQHALATAHHTLLDVRDRVHGVERASLDRIALPGLLATARRGETSLDDLERAAWDGAFEDALPGFRELMLLRRPGLTHRYTVGAHSLRTLVALGEPAPGVIDTALEGPYARELCVAALTHDIGKRAPGEGHASRGAAEARGVARRLGLLPAEAGIVAMLVAEHLLLPHVATTADLADEDVVLTTAARIGDQALVAPLYQLAVADLRATGPDVWTPWRTALMGDLASKLEAALSPDVDGAGIVASAEETRAAALRVAASRGSSRTVLDFLERVPLRYLATRDYSAVLRDAALVRETTAPGGAREVSFSVRPGPIADTHALDIVMRDRPGLFAGIAAAIELSGLSVLAAEAYTSANGIALDSFTVTTATRAPVTGSTWSTFEHQLHTALLDRELTAARLGERRTCYDRDRLRPRTADVRTGPHESFGTTLTVRADDRTGLLYDLAHVLEEASLDIRRAAVDTVARRARDTFVVTDAAGEPPAPEWLRENVVPRLVAVASR